MERLEELGAYIRECSTAPTLAGMPHRTLADKWIDGPTGAHVVEELHTPLNLAYVTATTGTTAFQNLVGVTEAELEGRVAASARVFELAGIGPGDTLLVTYPPLVSVFSRPGLEGHGVRPAFMAVSSRDAFLHALCTLKPRAVIGESAFMRLALEDAHKLGLLDLLPQPLTLLAAGTPLDTGLIPVARDTVGGTVHDLYGCQEFGWLTLDGIPLRDDIELVPDGGEYALVAGGLPTGDSFPVLEAGHLCNRAGKIITYGRRRGADLEVTVLESTAAGLETVQRLARSILRIKAKIVRLSPDIKLGAPQTVLALHRYGEEQPAAVISGKTGVFDALLEAQLAYQARAKSDPAWVKGR